jgi:hypothetical protein
MMTCEWVWPAVLHSNWVSEKNTDHGVKNSTEAEQSAGVMFPPERQKFLVLSAQDGFGMIFWFCR